MSHELPLPETPRVTLAHVASDKHILWTVMMLAFVLNALMTLYRFGRRLAELNPVVLALIPAFGPMDAFISLKLVVLVVTVVAWRAPSSRYRGAILIGVIVPWGVAGLMNTQLIPVTVSGQAAGASR